MPIASVVGRAAAKPTIARIRGVRMALQSASFSFSGLALPDIFKTMQALGLTEIDIMSEHIENLLGAPGIQLPGAGRPGPWTRPAGAAPGGLEGLPVARRHRRHRLPARPRRRLRPARRPGLRPRQARHPPARRSGAWIRPCARRCASGVSRSTWRRFREVKAEFDKAGRILFSYNLSFNDSWTDAGDRARHADDEGARHQHHHRVVTAVGDAARGAAGREARRHRRAAQPSGRARGVREGDGALAEDLGQPRRRPLLRDGPRSRRLPAGASPADHQHPRQGSQVATAAARCRSARAKRRFARC